MMLFGFNKQENRVKHMSVYISQIQVVTNRKNFFCQPSVSCILDHRLICDTPISLAISTHALAYWPVTSFVLSGNSLALLPYKDLQGQQKLLKHKAKIKWWITVTSSQSIILSISWTCKSYNTPEISSQYISNMWNETVTWLKI